MGLVDIGKKHVLQAIAECRRLGEPEFLARYGFRESRRFLLLHKGKVYQSKAVVGAAHGYAVGKPLGPYRFSGGDATVARLLEKLGFTVHLQRFHDVSLLRAVSKKSVALRRNMTPWIPWTSRGDKTEKAWPGVYAIGKFSRRPSRVLPLSKGVIYIGQTSRTIDSRLDEFEASVRGESGHSGGWTFHNIFGRNLKDVYVSMLPIRLPGSVRDMAIGLIERVLIWQYTSKWRHQPKCNSK